MGVRLFTAECIGTSDFITKANEFFSPKQILPAILSPGQGGFP